MPYAPTENSDARKGVLLSTINGNRVIFKGHAVPALTIAECVPVNVTNKTTPPTCVVPTVVSTFPTDGVTGSGNGL